MKFINLHGHSVFSIGDGLNYPKEHFDFVVENAESESMAMAISDHGNASSFGYAFQAQKSLRKKGIDFKFIPAVEFYYHPNLDNWQKIYDAKKEGNVEELDEGLLIEVEDESKGKYYDPIKRRHHLVVVAYNKIGIRNLYKLVSRSYRFGYYRYPRIDNSMLDECKEGLVISSACIAGLPAWSILKEERTVQDHIKELDKELRPLMDMFPKGHAHLEIQFNKLAEQRAVNDVLIEYSKQTGYPLLATADSHYAKPEYWKERELYRMLAWQTKGMDVSKDNLPESIDDLKCELYPKNGEQMFKEYRSMYSNDANPELDEIIKGAITRGWDIGNDLCEYIEPDGAMKLPVKKVGNKTSFEILEDLCIQGLERKGLHAKEEYIERLATELKVIKNKNFSDYFITLSDAMKEIKKHQLSSPGRGSGAGSLVLYILDITQLDPIKNDLLFERFLSEFRDEPPDVDLDSDDRTKSLEILKKLFGETEVLPISNYNTLQLKSLVKDISRLYEIPFDEVNDVTTKIEDEARKKIIDDLGGDQKLYDLTFDAALKYSPTFKSFIDKYPDIGNHIRILYKQIKSIGRHAGGVAITNNAEEAMPVIKVRGEYQTPWSEGLTAKHLEPQGIIKYDFLAITTLAFIRRCIESILEEQLGEAPSFEQVDEFYTKNLHPDNVEDGEGEIFESVYQAGKFPGIFQFTQNDAQSFCVDAKPERVMDLAVITSIYRPGPLCLSGDTDVVASVHYSGKNGRRHIRRKTLKDLYHSFKNKINSTTYYLSSFDFEKKEVIKNKIVQIHKAGHKKLFKIKFRIHLQGPNNEIKDSSQMKMNRAKDVCKASADHLFYTNNGWKKLSGISGGDYILRINSTIYTGEDPKRETRKSGSVFGRKNFRNICFRNYEYKCLFCDWSEASLDVNHVEDNRNVNNNPENLCFLCPNHHRMFTEGIKTKKDIDGVINKRRLPELNKYFSWALVQSVEECGTEETYDIEMKSPHNNFFAGGFLVHNSGGVPEKYVRAVHNPEDVSYDHPILKEVLGQTYGYIVFQEDFMILANKLAGFSLEEANTLRKLLVKPVTSMGDEMKKQRLEAGERFIKGCLEKGLDEERAERLWNEEILGFISYGFNKSLHEESLVTICSQDGPIDKRIKDVKPGDMVKSRNEGSKEEVFVAVSGIHDHNELECYEIELETGEKIRCTINHKFRVQDGRMLPLHQIIQENLDIVVSSVENPAPGLSLIGEVYGED